MGEHIKNGRFVSDKYRVTRIANGVDASEDKLVLSFNDPAALAALHLYSLTTKDEELGDDILERLNALLTGMNAKAASARRREGS